MGWEQNTIHRCPKPDMKDAPGSMPDKAIWKCDECGKRYEYRVGYDQREGAWWYFTELR
jgi:transposase-like protein